MTEKKHRSVSQESSYSDCGLRYKLERIDRHSQLPAWWNIGGHAFHSTIEQYENDRLNGDLMTVEQLTQHFIDEYAAEIAEANTLEIDESLYRGAKHGKENREWWLENGVKMCLDYAEAELERNYEVLQVSEEWTNIVVVRPALELRFELDVDGVLVVGFIDQVFVYPNGDVLVRDLKTGARTPGDTFQLGVYAWALKRCYGVDAVWGEYWMARKAERTRPIQLYKAHPWEQLVYRFHTMDRAENAGIYLPRVSSFCNSCGVRAVCPMHP